MAVQIYSPFKTFNFSNSKCFLTGENLASGEEKVHVFPTWLMSRYNLEDKPFRLLDESYTTYKELKVPCSVNTFQHYLEPLESEIEAAFEKGYEGVKELDGLRIFQWAGKWLYGILFNEIQSAIKQQHAQGEELHISQSILEKFGNLHLMLQTLNLPIHFDEFTPYSLFLFKVNNGEDEFSYRDEINTLTLSLRVKDLGLIIVLQDNGANQRYHKELLEKIGSGPLHPIQFEEICAKIYYSAYLFNRLPQYHVMPMGDQLYIDAMPLRGVSSKPLFDDWQEKTYGQVLESFWKKWGFLLLEIIKDPENPMSFLIDPKDGHVIAAEEIDLPL